MAEKFNIFSFPVLLYIKDGEVIAREDGVRNPAQLESSVMKYFQ